MSDERAEIDALVQRIAPHLDKQPPLIGLVALVRLVALVISQLPAKTRDRIITDIPPNLHNILFEMEKLTPQPPHASDGAKPRKPPAH